MSAASCTSVLLAPNARSSMQAASGIGMGKSGQEQGPRGQIHARTFAERVAEFLRIQHPQKTAQHVEGKTGLSAATVRKWLEQGNTPNGEAMLALSKSYGPLFLCAAYPDDQDAWFFEVARQQEQARLEAQAATIRRQLAEVMGGR